MPNARVRYRALLGGDSSNWNNLMINGRERRIAENSNFWTTVEGPLKMNDKPTNILDFDFETTSEELGSAMARKLQLKWRVRVFQRQGRLCLLSQLLGEEGSVHAP